MIKDDTLWKKVLFLRHEVLYLYKIITKKTQLIKLVVMWIRFGSKTRSVFVVIIAAAAVYYVTCLRFFFKYKL